MHRVAEQAIYRELVTSRREVNYRYCTCRTVTYKLARMLGKVYSLIGFVMSVTRVHSTQVDGSLFVQTRESLHVNEGASCTVTHQSTFDFTPP